ncbi:MAG: hypothetical protein ACOC47_02000 [Alkalispirochaetaceae bacterium]
MTIDTIGNSTNIMQTRMAQLGLGRENEATEAVSRNQAEEMAARNEQNQYMRVEGEPQEGMLAAYQGQNVDMMA